MASEDYFEEISGHSEAPIEPEFIFDPTSDTEATKEFLEAVESVDDGTKLSKDDIRTFGEAVVKYSGAVRPDTKPRS